MPMPRPMQSVPATSAAVMLVWPQRLWAHDGGTWAWDPAVILPLVVAAAVYAGGTASYWRRAGIGRGLSRARVVCFATGIFLTAVLLLSPIEHLTELLLSAHMVQHFGLMLVAAPLFVLGRPGVAVLRLLPEGWRARIASLARTSTVRAFKRPAVAWGVYFGVLWIWHAPPVYEAALSHQGIHTLQHASFLGAALLFWSAVLEPSRGEGRAAAFAAVFATALQSCALAALITTSAVVWYPTYGGAFGLSALEDQQLGGLVMWVPCCAILIGAALAVFAGVLNDAERRVERTQ